MSYTIGKHSCRVQTFAYQHVRLLKSIYLDSLKRKLCFLQGDADTDEENPVMMCSEFHFIV